MEHRPLGGTRTTPDGGGDVADTADISAHGESG